MGEDSVGVAIKAMTDAADPQSPIAGLAEGAHSSLDLCDGLEPCFDQPVEAPTVPTQMVPSSVSTIDFTRFSLFLPGNCFSLTPP